MRQFLYPFLFGICSFCMLGAEKLQAQSLDSQPFRQELHGGIDLLSWVQNVDSEASYIVPELLLKYQFHPRWTLNFVSGYQVVKKDSVFYNADYRSEGWFIKGGPEYLVPLDERGYAFLSLGGNLVYSSFNEQASVHFRYANNDFDSEVDPANSFRYTVSDRSRAYALEFQQGVWVRIEDRLSIFIAHRISTLLNSPENPYMKVHHIPGVGVLTSEYYRLSRNHRNEQNSVFWGLRVYVSYKLF